jgi:3-oxoacyl-[acyl-carrier-protein] synthase II
METLLERGVNRISPYFVPQMLPDTAPGLVAIEFNVRGPNMSISTACASGNNALGEAAHTIARGAADVMLTGGSEAALVKVVLGGFSNMGALSRGNEDPARASRPFDAERDGFVAAEGAAVLVLESLDHALARGARILGEFHGYGTAADAFHLSAPHEHGDGAVNAMRWALADAGFEPERIDVINAHGTGTRLNDAIETAAIKRVFGDRAYAIPTSSTKSFHGHLLGAAGALEAIISLRALGAQVIPPTRNYSAPDPECDLDYVTEGPRPATFDTVLSNNFGFGGHNATVILGRYHEA